MPRCRNTRPTNAMGNFDDFNGGAGQHVAKGCTITEKNRASNAFHATRHPWPTPSPSPPPTASEGQLHGTSSLPSLADIPIVQQKRKHISSSSTGRDPTHIPRPRNAFILYRSSVAAASKTQTQSHARPCTAQQDVLSREAGRMWRAESEGVRRHFEQLAQEEKRRHALMYPEYRYAPKKVPVSGLLPSAVPTMTRARDTSSRSSVVNERVRATQPPATRPTLARPSTKKSRQESKAVVLPSPLPSPTTVRSQAFLIEDESDDELEYDFDDYEEDEDTQPWDSLFSNVISTSTRQSANRIPEFSPNNNNNDYMDIDYASYGGRVSNLAAGTFYTPVSRIGNGESIHGRSDGMTQRMAGLHVNDHL